MTYQSNGCVVHVNEFTGEWRVIDAECNAVEAQLASNVKTTLLHIHGNQLHRSHASEYKHTHTAVLKVLPVQQSSVIRRLFFWWLTTVLDHSQMTHTTLLMKLAVE